MSYLVNLNDTSVKLRIFFGGGGGKRIYQGIAILLYPWNTLALSILGTEWQECFRIFILNAGILVGDNLSLEMVRKSWILQFIDLVSVFKLEHL